MNNEPVGYVYSVAGEPIKSAKINPQIPNGTPLYTHPSKDLTDEEILEVAQKMGWRGALGFLINFARAILKKASEK